MPPSLPPEILDLIAEALTTHTPNQRHSGPAVSSPNRGLIGREHTSSLTSNSALETPISNCWKKAFPDPSTSPAHHTRHLLIRGILAATGEDTCGWIRAFHNLVHLQLEGTGWNYPVTLVPFHGLSPTLRSLRLISTSPGVLDLVCSFPLLEDLALISPSHRSDAWNIPPTSPKLTGSLTLCPRGDPSCRTSIIESPEWSPLHQDLSASRQWHPLGDGFSV